ncbi:MAG: hypothetical protein ACREI2_11960, partial [Nitrospiraceae bacterium]
TKEDYYGAYLGMDERNCAIALVESVTGTRDPMRIRRILKRKAALFRDYTATHKPQLFPGAAEFVKRAGQRYRLAIASGWPVNGSSGEAVQGGDSLRSLSDHW